MPDGRTAAEFFKNQSKTTFYNDVISLDYSEKKGNIRVDKGVREDLDRIFFMENGKRVSLVDRYGTDIFSANIVQYKRPELLDTLYDLVDTGNLYFYNRGSDELQQYRFTTTNNKNYHVGPEVMTPEEIEKTPGLAAVNARRKEQAKGENERYAQHLVAIEQERVLKSFSGGKLLQEMKNGRQRAHAALSVTKPGTLTFMGTTGEKHEFKPIDYKGGSRFTPEEMELIVLASCNTSRASSKTGNPHDAGLTGDQNRILSLNVAIHQDMLLSGRGGSTETAVPIFEEGRKIAGELINGEMEGQTQPLKETLMSSLRDHILVCRDTTLVGPTRLRQFEETKKMADMMAIRQLYTDQKEFEELQAEAIAMNTIAKICIAGAEAEQELLQAHKNGGFKNEAQRQSIAGRLAAYRYITARETLASKECINREKYKEIAEKITAVYMNPELSPEERGLQNNALLADRAMSAERSSSVQEIMDMIKKGGNVEEHIKDFALLTTEGQQLLVQKTPFKMIEAVVKQPQLTEQTDLSDVRVEDFRKQQATRMDTSAAKEFWAGVLQAMGPDQFNLNLLPEDFDRLIVMKGSESGIHSTESLKDFLHIASPDMRIRTMDDAAMMERVRDLIASGNVFFYQRGVDVPHRLSLDENGMATMSEDPVQATRPGLWARFAHFITGGRAYRKEFEHYEQERYLKSSEVLITRQKGNEIDTEKDALKKAKKKKDRNDFVAKPHDSFYDMEAVRARAHKVLSLDEPEAVGFNDTNTPDYKGTPHTIPAGVKEKFTKDQLDAICVAAIFSPAAAKKHMEAGLSTAKGSNEVVTADVVGNHVYPDILAWGRYNSHFFFPLVDAGRQIAADVLNNYAKGETRQLAELLGNNIRAAVLNGRFEVGVKRDAALANDMAWRMMGILDSDPNLKAQCGIDEETLNSYRQELKALCMIGDAYERAGNAFKRLGEAVQNNRPLTQQESMEIATDLLTYRYLNGIQVNAREQLSQREDIAVEAMVGSLRKRQYDLQGKELNPNDGETFMLASQGKVREYYFSPEEEKDHTYQLKQLYNKPHESILTLGKENLEQIRDHVRNAVQTKELMSITDPMALANEFKAKYNKDVHKNLNTSVDSSRINSELNRRKEHSQQLQEKINEMSGVLKGPDPLVNSVKQPEPVKKQNLGAPSI